MEYRVGIIGCGKPRKTQGATGFGMSHAHARGYAQSGSCKIVALADISLDNAKAFQAEHGGDALYTDYHEMLAREKLDIVSIATWPALHAPMVIAAATAGVKAIHCEKPMAPTFGESRRMVDVCREHGVQLTFNHQRRFNTPFREARKLLKDGAIGHLLRIEATCPDLFDWGTHWFDMMFMYNDQTPAEWVIGQIDTRGLHQIFGTDIEGQGLAHIKFKNDVRGLMITGHDAKLEANNRLVGTEGVIEIGGPTDNLRIWNKGRTFWEAIPTTENIHAGDAVQRGVLDLVDSLRTGRQPELSGNHALQATELIFATYESSRRRARVDLPLTIDDSPLSAMVEEKK